MIYLNLRFQYCKKKIQEDDAVRVTLQLSGLCRRSAGNLDWMPLVETVLRTNTDENNEKGIFFICKIISKQIN